MAVKVMTKSERLEDLASRLRDACADTCEKCRERCDEEETSPACKTLGCTCRVTDDLRAAEEAAQAAREEV